MDRYIAVVKQLENKKFLIKFPDFEGVTGIAEKEESIDRVAKGILNTKLQELRYEKLEIPSPMGIAEVQKTLEEGEFTTFVFAKEEKNILNKENLKETFGNIREKSEELLKGDLKENMEKIYSKSEELVQNKLGENIKSENYNMVGVGAGILYALSALMPLVSIEIPFLKTIRLGFTNLSDIEQFNMFIDLSSQMFMVRFIVILMIICGGFVAYSSYKKCEFFFKSGMIMATGLWGVSFIYVFMQMMRLESEARKNVGFSFAWFGLFVAIVLMGISFILSNKAKQVEEE